MEMLYYVYWGSVDNGTPSYDCEQLITEDIREANEKFQQFKDGLKQDWLTENACGNRNKYLNPCHDFCCELVQMPTYGDWDNAETIEFAKYGYDEWSGDGV